MSPTCFPADRYRFQRVATGPGRADFVLDADGVPAGRFVEQTSTRGRLGVVLGLATSPPERVLHLEGADGALRLAATLDFGKKRSVDIRVEDPAGRVLGHATKRPTRWLDHDRPTELTDASGVALGSLQDDLPADLVDPAGAVLGRFTMDAEETTRRGGLVFVISFAAAASGTVRDLAAFAALARDLAFMPA